MYLLRKPPLNLSIQKKDIQTCAKAQSIHGNGLVDSQTTLNALQAVELLSEVVLGYQAKVQEVTTRALH